MSDTDPVLATYNDIRQQVQIRASVSEEGVLREEVFTRWGRRPKKCSRAPSWVECKER
jgi:hypothetical protein